MNQAGGVSAYVRVVIKSGAVSAITLTDPNGNFAVSKIPTPYDAMVLIGSSVTVTVGLTSATPTVLDMFSSDTSPGGSASLSRTVTGGIGFPPPGPSLTSVLFSSTELQANLVANNNTGAYSTDDAYFDWDGNPIPTSWSGPATTTGTLYALQSEGQIDWEPNSYSGYGFKENVSLANGSAVTGQDIALTAVTPAVFAGMYTPPAGYTVEQKMVAIEFGRGGVMLIEFDTTSSETFSYNTPNISGATLILASAAIKGDAYSVVVNTGLAVDATDVTTSSPAATEELAFTSTGVTTGTEFLFTAVRNAVHLPVLASGASEYSSSVPSYIFLTAGNSATIPDLHSFGLNLPTSTDYTWLVYGLGPYADVEAATAGLCGEHQWGFLSSFGGLPLNLSLVNSNSGGFVTSFGPGHFTTAA